jgi:hypothetical protein
MSHTLSASGRAHNRAPLLYPGGGGARKIFQFFIDIHYTPILGKFKKGLGAKTLCIVSAGKIHQLLGQYQATVGVLFSAGNEIVIRLFLL